MVSIKCGSCGMVFNLSEEGIKNNTAIDMCPNCRTRMPVGIRATMPAFLTALSDSDNWKVYIVPEPEELRKLQL
jgi:hypothetical protein